VKKIIKGRLCDTDTAHKIGVWDNGQYGSLEYASETLYRTRSGQFFIHVKGESRSMYAKSVDLGSWTAGESIFLMSFDSAKEWAEEHLTKGEYNLHFEIPEGGDKVTMTVIVNASTKAILEEAKAKTGRPISALVDEWAENMKKRMK